MQAPGSMETQEIQSFDAEQCHGLLARLEADWVDYDTVGAPPFKKIYERTVHNIGGLETSDVIVNIREQTAQLYLRLGQLGVLNTDDLLRRRLTRVLEVIGFTAILINTTHRTQQAVGNNSDTGDIGGSFYSFSTMTNVMNEDVKTYQRLLLHLFCQAQMHGYRRYGDSVYKPILTEEGHNTHSWARVSDIRSFVYMSCQKEFHFDQWKLLTDHPSYPKHAETYLTGCEDLQFPRLVKNRHAFSFQNGIYLAATDTWAAFGQAGAVVPGGLCCAKHFDNLAPPEFTGARREDWRDIPTPAFDTMLRCQNLLGEVSDWLLIFIGRLIYEVGEKDNW